MIPSREIPFFGEAPKRFWAIIGVHSGEFGWPEEPNSVIRVTRRTE
jgi:hypothetical protein